MSARSVLLSLVALIAAIASEPFHDWLHTEQAAVWSGHREIHGGDCDHQPEHLADDGCLLCARGHAASIAPPRPDADREPTTTVAALRVDASVPRPASARGTLGARGPPARG